MLGHLLRVAVSTLREAVKRRSPEWRAVELAHLRAQDACRACGEKRRLQVHHIKPFHLDPGAELDPLNLVTLCMGPAECHLRIGHGGMFRAYNPDVLEDAGRARAGDRAGAERHAAWVRRAL